VQDLRFSLRMLRRNPGFATVAVVVLALGIGANTAIFSVVEAVLIRPLPYHEAARLIWISRVLPALHARLVTSTDYIARLEQNKTVTGISAVDESESLTLIQETPAGPEPRASGLSVHDCDRRSLLHRVQLSAFPALPKY